MKRNVVILTFVIFTLSTAGAGAEGLDRTSVFRDDLIVTVENYRELATLMPIDPRVAEQLDWAHARLMALPVREYELLAPHIGAGIRSLRRTSELLLDERFREEPPDVSWTSGTLPDAPYPDLNWTFDIAAPTDVNTPIPGGSSTTTEFGTCNFAWSLPPDVKFILQNEVLVGEAIHDATSRICAAITPAGELLCIVSDILFVALHGIQDHAFMCDSMMYEAEVSATYLRLGHIHEDIGELRSDVTARIATLESNTKTEADHNETLIVGIGDNLALHDTNMATRTDSIADRIRDLSALVAEIREEELRMMIEISLADTDNKQVGIFRFPQAVGGHLETVRAIVGQCIDDMKAAGHDVGNAEALMVKANWFMSDGDWEQAYTEFGRAYRAAAGQTGGKPAVQTGVAAVKPVVARRPRTER